MTMLAQAQHPAPSPTKWTGEMVRERLVEAFEIDRRLPRDRRQGIGSPHGQPSRFTNSSTSFTGMKVRSASGVWESWERGGGASPAEVSSSLFADYHLKTHAEIRVADLVVTDNACLSASRR
jgi:hypothetical protein